MSLWKVAEWKSMQRVDTFHFHNPSLVMNAAFSWTSGLRGTYQ